MRHKILVADDEINIRTALGRIFHDCVVLSAENGEAALRVIMNERPSLVLLDLKMPVMGGVEVLLSLKGAENAPLFIVLTGNEDLEMAERVLEMGAVSYITKPFTAEGIRKAVLSALGGGEDGEYRGARPWRVKQ